MYLWAVWVAIAVAPSPCPHSVVSQASCSSSYCSSHQCRQQQTGQFYGAAVIWQDEAGTQWCKCQCCNKPLGICGPNDTGPQVTYTGQCTAAAAGPAPPPSATPPSGAPPPCADVGVTDGASCTNKCGAGSSGYKSVNDAGQCDCNGKRLCGEDVEVPGGGALKFILVLLLIGAVCGGAAFVKHKQTKESGVSEEPLVTGGF